MKPKGNPTPINNPPNPVPNLPADPYSDSIFSDSSSSDSSDSSESEYLKQVGRTKNSKKKRQSKKSFNEAINKCANITTKLLKYVYNSKVTEFKTDEDPIQQRVYFLYFINELKLVLSQFK